jgi:hypothetical protein
MSRMHVVLTFAVLAASPAFANDETPPCAPTPSAPANEPPGRAAAGGANMVVAKDPETGKLRPATAAESEKLLGRRPLVSPAREIVTLPDGTVMVKRGPSDASYAVAKRNPDGTLSTACVQGADAANAAVATTPAPAPSPAPKNADR